MILVCSPRPYKLVFKTVAKQGASMFGMNFLSEYVVHPFLHSVFKETDSE